MRRGQTCVAGVIPASCCIKVSALTGESAWWLNVPLLPGCDRVCFLVPGGPCSSSDSEAECSSPL